MRNLCQNVMELLEKWNIQYRIDNDGRFVVKRSRHRLFIPPVGEDLAYLLGIICGDGCLRTPQPRKCGGARFTAIIYMPNSINGRIQADHMCKLFEKNFGYTPNVATLERPGKSWLEIRTNSVVIYAYLVSLGLPIGKKYGKLKVPLVVHKKNLFRRFLCGLIDSDGHLTKSELVIVQKDRGFLDKVRRLSLKFLGIKFTPPKPNIKTVVGKVYTWYYMRSKDYIASSNK